MTEHLPAIEEKDSELPDLRGRLFRVAIRPTAKFSCESCGTIFGTHVQQNSKVQGQVVEVVRPSATTASCGKCRHLRKVSGGCWAVRLQGHTDLLVITDGHGPWSVPYTWLIPIEEGEA